MWCFYLWLASILPAIYIGREFVHASSCDGCKTTFWWRLRRDFWLSRPGQKGNLARISMVRQRVRRYARMERRGTIVLAGELSTLLHSFRLIATEGNYQAYERHFIPSKKVFWIELGSFVLWPISVPALILCLLLRSSYVVLVR